MLYPIYPRPRKPELKYLVEVARDVDVPPSPDNTLTLQFTSWFTMVWVVATRHPAAVVAGRYQIRVLP